MHAEPADQGHKRLEESKCSRNKEHFAFFHFRLVKTVGKRYGKSIHSKAYAEADCRYKKHKIHLLSLDHRAVTGTRGVFSSFHSADTVFLPCADSPCLTFTGIDKDRHCKRKNDYDY